MRYEQEKPRGKDLGVKHNRPEIDFEKISIPASSFLDAPGALLNLGENDQEAGLRETRLVLRKVDRRGNGGEQFSREDTDQKPNGFEPFLNSEPQEGNLFVNNYGGNYSQRMELNRRGVERTLQIAHLDGKVFLSNFQQSKSRPEAQGNELAAKRFLIFDSKTQKAEEDNPYKRVTSIPEGWRIEINDQRITEELSEQQKLSGEKLQKAFIKNFNQVLNGGIFECVRREKLSSEKDRLFIFKTAKSIVYAVTVAVGQTPMILANSPLGVSLYLGSMPFGFAILNFLNKQSLSSRKIDDPLEYFMPPVEIDKVARTFAYLAGKGRRLVREAKEDKFSA